MNELNGNEKYHYLSENLPTDSYRPVTIRNGDLMLYGSNCVVLFYETFASSYSYTRIGQLGNPSGLASVLGQGNVSVTANIAPRLMHELCVAAIGGQVRRAMEIQFQLMPVHKNLFVEANPIPLKWAMARMGLCGPTLRLPMTPLSAANEPVVEAALRASGLLTG